MTTPRAPRTPRAVRDPVPMARRRRNARRRTPPRAAAASPTPAPAPAPSAADLARFGARFFARVQPLAAFVADVNAALPARVPPVVLVEPARDAAHPAYARLARDVLVAWPDPAAAAAAAALPDGLAEGLTARAAAFPHEELVARVIASALRKYPSGYDAQARNVLCNGFSLGRPDGPGSVFRNLDARAPSGAVNILLSPPWRRLCARLGHVAARHLFANAALLVPVVAADADVPSVNAGALMLMQLCGPLPRRHSSSSHAKDTVSRVSLKQNVLYHGSISAKRGTSVPATGVLNAGLPSGHVLQTMRPEDPAAPKRLYHAIFSSSKSRSEVGDSTHDVPPGAPYRETKRARISEPASTVRAANTGSCAATAASAPDAPQQSGSPRIPARMRPTLPLLQGVLSRVGKRSFRAVLSETCPLAAEDNPMRSNRPMASRELAKMTTKPSHVSRFLVRCLRQALPLCLFGSLENRAVFESAVHTLVRKRTQNEHFDLTSFFAGKAFCLKDVTWLHRKGKSSTEDSVRRVCNPTDLQFRIQHLHQFLRWLVRSFCIPLLCHNFYVSESESSRHRIVYYRREVWAALTDATLDVMVKSDQRQFSLLTTSALAAATRRRDSAVTELGSSFCPFPVFTYSHMRFLPKSSGARGIQRPRAKLFQSFLGSRSVFASKVDRMPTSTILRKSQQTMKMFYANSLEILWSESRLQADSVGASVFSNNGIYEKYSKLVRDWRQGGKPKMYLVCMDITRSFDTIPLTSLLENVLKPLLKRDRYMVLRYAVVKKNVSNQRLLCRFCHYVCEEPGEESHFPRLMKNKLRARHRGALFIDLASVSVVTRTQLLSSLSEVLTNNVVLLPRRFRRRSTTAYALQSQGLPQGSQLSSILTSLFYGYVERSDLSEFLRRDGSCEATTEFPLQLFMRQVDDTFYCGSDENFARRLAQRMTRGWDDTHGYVINPAKTRSSFDPGVGDRNEQRFIPWCGYVFDANTLEVRGDYDRYVSSESRLRDTLSIVYGAGAMETFLSKASTCFRPKLHALLLDSNINSKRTVALNLYQAALLSALKVSSYAIALFPARRGATDPNTPRQFGLIVKTMVEKFRGLVGLAVVNSVSLRHGCMFPLEQHEVLFLINRAYWGVFQKYLNSAWFACDAYKFLELKDAELQHSQHRGRIVNLADIFKCVLDAKASPALWLLKP